MAAATQKVRISMWPDQVKEVPVDEVPILRAQGLLVEDGDDGAKTGTGPAKTTSSPRPGRGQAGQTTEGA